MQVKLLFRFLTIIAGITVASTAVTPLAGSYNTPVRFSFVKNDPSTWTNEDIKLAFVALKQWGWLAEKLEVVLISNENDNVNSVTPGFYNLVQREIEQKLPDCEIITGEQVPARLADITSRDTRSRQVESDRVGCVASVTVELRTYSESPLFYYGTIELSLMRMSGGEMVKKGLAHPADAESYRKLTPIAGTQEEAADKIILWMTWLIGDLASDRKYVEEIRKGFPNSNDSEE